MVAVIEAWTSQTYVNSPASSNVCEPSSPSAGVSTSKLPSSAVAVWRTE